MNQQTKYYVRLGSWTLFILATFFFQRLQPLAIIFMLVSLVWDHGTKSEIKSKLNWSNPALWFFAYFIIHLIGVTYSKNTSEAWEDVSMKLSYFVFPIYFVINSSLNSKKVIRWFAITGLFSAIVCLGWLVINRVVLDVNPLVNESDFSLFLHRSYQATYWCICLIYFLFNIADSKDKRWMNVLAIILLSSAIILTFSKAGMLILMLSYLLFFIWLVVRYKNYKAAVLSFIVIALIGFTINYITPKPLARFSAMITNSFSSSNTAVTTDSNKARILMWSTSLEVAKENVIAGVGTGDVNEALRNRNSEKGLTSLVDSNLNSHNQFLNSFVALGLIGLLLFTGIFVSSFMRIKRNGINRIASYLMLFSIVFFSLTESAFETQAGIVTFTCLILLLTCNNSLQTEE